MVGDRRTKAPIVAEARRILAKAKEKGVILGMAGMGLQFDNSVVKIKPPLAITEEEADTVLRVFDECLREVS